jgi:hypothetical protein
MDLEALDVIDKREQLALAGDEVEQAHLTGIVLDVAPHAQPTSTNWREVTSGRGLLGEWPRGPRGAHE